MQWAPADSITLACRASSSGSAMCDIIRKPETSIPRSRALAMCCSAMSASVAWVATRTEVVGGYQVVDGADPGQQQCGQPRALDHLGRGGDPLPVGRAAGTVGEAGAGKAVAVGDFDSCDPGHVEGGGDPAQLVDRQPVTDGVHPVAKCDVLDVELRHGTRSSIRAERLSPTRSAAEVMMSRF